jgi:hypothetical protein
MLPIPSNAYFTEDAPPDSDGDRETLPPPTIPNPTQSEVRIRVRGQRPVVDLVTADLELDPRSEDYLGDTIPGPAPVPLLGPLPPPPAHSLPAPTRSGPMPAGSEPMPRSAFELPLRSVIAPKKAKKTRRPTIRRRAS